MRGTYTLELDNNAHGRLLLEITELCSWMTWDDARKIVEQCREITKPMRDAARQKYFDKKNA